MSNVTSMLDNKNGYAALARVLDKKHGFDEGLYIFTQALVNTRLEFYGTAFKEVVTTHYPIDGQAVNDLPMVYAAIMVPVWENAFGKSAPNNEDRILSYAVSKLPEDDPVEIFPGKINVSKIVDKVKKCESSYISGVFDFVSGLIESLEEAEFLYCNHRYEYSKEFILVLRKGTTVVKVSVWIDDIYKTAII